ncbi:HEL308Cp [Eremothecium sinecaudum]|uniref:HEL308Cp n=1 Tax=Eremothecium sinecaudum TaxID=45286 RepID=A0A109UZX1_9SACH|nr:HEL308Cp [Eremothecium sinecaudum]AMD20973.1 HEL308Cp [Eremothecium sinecaudum]
MNAVTGLIFEVTYITVAYALPIGFTLHTIHEADDFCKKLGTSPQTDNEMSHSENFRASDAKSHPQYHQMQSNTEKNAPSLDNSKPQLQTCVYWCAYWLITCLLDRFVYPGAGKVLSYAGVSVNGIMLKIGKLILSMIILIHSYVHPADRKRPLGERNLDRFWSFPSSLLQFYTSCVQQTSATLNSFNVDCKPDTLTALLDRGNTMLTVDQHLFFNRGARVSQDSKEPESEKAVFVMDTHNSYDILSASECNSILSYNSSASINSSADSNTGLLSNVEDSGLIFFRAPRHTALGA